MVRIDTDLMSTQEARILIENARESQRILQTYTQEQIDKIVDAMAQYISTYVDDLAEMAVSETGFGIVSDKIIKNKFASETLYKYIKPMKTIGIIDTNLEKQTFDVAVPVGVIVALLPCTNPTSTAIATSLIAIKAGNAIVFSLHPKAKNVTARTLDLLMEAAKNAGAPDDVISYLHIISPEGTQELMSHKDTSLVLVNTSKNMIHKGHQSGKPTINGGPGNSPAFIERTANIDAAVKDIIRSKTFDNGLLCSAEQSIVADGDIAEKVIEALKREQAYFMNVSESNRLGEILFDSCGKHNINAVGKSAYDLATMAGFSVPYNTTVLISMQEYVSISNPYCKEKLCPVLAFFVEKDWRFACEKCIELLITEGKGHTLVIHSNDESVIKEFALKKPVSRMLVNTSGSLGGIGLTTNLPPTFILSTGTMGGGFTADNVSPLNLINIRKVGYGKLEHNDCCISYRKDNDLINGQGSGNHQELTELFDSLISDLYK